MGSIFFFFFKLPHVGVITVPVGGRTGVAAVFQRRVCVFVCVVLLRLHITSYKVAHGDSQPEEGGNSTEGVRAICDPHVHVHGRLCLLSQLRLWKPPPPHAPGPPGYCIERSHACVHSRREAAAAVTLPVMFTSTIPVRVPMLLVASQTYVPARS